MLADVRFERSGGRLVARVAGDIDMSNATEVGRALDRAIDADTLALVIDLSAADYVDSAGIHLFFDLRNRLQMRGLALRLVVPPASPARTSLELAGVLRTLDVEDG